MLTDYNNLKYFMNTQSLTGRQARVAKQLATYNFNIEYKKGTANPSYRLSRRLDYFAGFKDTVKREQLNRMLPTLQQKLRVIALGLNGGATDVPDETRSGSGTGTRRAAANNAKAHKQANPLPTIALVYEFFNKRQQRVTYSDTASSKAVATAKALASTIGCNLLVPRAIVAIATIDETAFTNPSESVIKLIRGI